MNLIAALCAISSPISPTVKLILQRPPPGSNAWDQLVFGDEHYKALNDTKASETRARAMADVMGQASRLLAKEDSEGNFSVRTFYKNKEGRPAPKLHISIRPTTGVGAQAPMDTGAELARVVEQATKLGFDFDSVPKAVAGTPGAYIGYLKAKIAEMGTAAANADIDQTSAMPEASGEENPL